MTDLMVDIKGAGSTMVDRNSGVVFEIGNDAHTSHCSFDKVWNATEMVLEMKMLRNLLANHSIIKQCKLIKLYIQSIKKYFNVRFDLMKIRKILRRKLYLF